MQRVDHKAEFVVTERQRGGSVGLGSRLAQNLAQPDQFADGRVSDPGA